MMRLRFPFNLPSRRRGSAGDDSPDGGSGKGFVQPVSRRTTPGRTAVIGCLFFGVFLLAGLGFLGFFAGPAIHVFQARSWEAVPCEIVESHVASHRGDDSTTYSVEVTYRYDAGGWEHTGNRYRFLGGSSSGYEGKQRVVDSLPPGTRTTCWVDPDNPDESVLDRGLHAEYLFALLPLIFVAVGAGGIFFSLAKARSMRGVKDTGAARWLPGGPGGAGAGTGKGAAAGGSGAAALVPSGQDAGSFSTATGGAAGFGTDGFSTSGGGGTTVLEPKMSPFGKLGCIVLLALFWNGIVSVFVVQLWKSYQAGSPDGCLTLFLIPFVLIGLVLLVGIPYQILALFNPRPRLSLTPGRLVLGRPADLTWSFHGSASRIRRLEINLVGREEADYTRGTDRHTAKEVFATLELVDSALPSAIPAGSVRIEMPADTMHSFSAPDNRIVWALKLQGRIRLWPDVLEELPVVVEPRPLEGGD